MRHLGAALSGRLVNYRPIAAFKTIFVVQKRTAMYFKEEQVDAMKSIFKRLDVKTIDSLQLFIKANDLRTGCTQVIYNKWKKPTCIFQNFEPLSPYRIKLLMRLSGQIPFPIYITKPREDIMRVGWKVE
ncbi:hypothetical protein ACM55G_14665 [Flavobacterium sp. LB3P122]|uniref:hypothetical protein n=1 Tax=Flavobacterium algoriphilum TaxID=3398738 RepID=UPI003A8A84C6